MTAPYYTDEHVTLYHGDCREVLPAACPEPGVIITDPPYGINYTSGWTRTSGVWGGLYANTDGSIAGDSAGSWAYDWLRDTYPDTPIAVFGSWRNGPPWPGYRALLVWDKGPAFGMGDLSVPWKPNHEPIWVYGDGWAGRRTNSVLTDTSVSSHLRAGRVHPHQKPVKFLMAELVSKAPPGIILDPFAGSGSTLVAARNLGRRAVGVEVEERYCETAANRLAQGVLL